MSRLLCLALFTGVLLSFGCKEEKVIEPKSVPAQPKTRPSGSGAGNQNRSTTAAPVMP